MSNILIIGNALENTGFGKSVRLIARDFERFVNVSLLYINRGAPIVDVFRQEYSDILTTKVKRYDGYLLVVDTLGIVPHKQISVFVPHEFEEIPDSIKHLSQSHCAITYTQRISDLFKQYGIHSTWYLPQIFLPKKTIATTGTYKFYTITNNPLPRKHIIENIIAYFSAFTIKDNVIYVVKVLPDMKQGLEKTIQSILQMNPIGQRTDLPRLHIDESSLSDEDIIKFHQAHDCYVGVSYGEGLNLCLYEAACIGNPIIYNNVPPGKEFFSKYFPIGMVQSQKDVAIHVGTSSAHYTPETQEYKPNMLEVGSTMKTLYQQDIRMVNDFSWSQFDRTKEVINIIKG